MLYYSQNQILKRVSELGYQTLPFMLVGIRSKKDVSNEFDDVIYLFNNGKATPFLATTNPGKDWLLNFMNPKGAAILKPGDWLFKLGTHKGYEALVQALPVTVYRDADKDLKSEAQGIEETGWFGINIHRASQWSISKYIGKWSAGCQVIANPSDFNYLIKACKEADLTTFKYILLDEF